MMGKEGGKEGLRRSKLLFCEQVTESCDPFKGISLPLVFCVVSVAAQSLMSLMSVKLPSYLVFISHRIVLNQKT